MARAEGAGQSIVGHLLTRYEALHAQARVLKEHAERFASLVRLHGGVS